MQKLQKSGKKNNLNKIVIIILCFLAVVLVLGIYGVVNLINPIIFLLEISLIFPLCLLVANQKEYNKRAFYFFLIIIIYYSAFLIDISLSIDTHSILAIVVFCFYLFWYLVIGIPILYFSQKQKGSPLKNFLNIFKRRMSLFIFTLCSLFYLFTIFFSDF